MSLFRVFVDGQLFYHPHLSQLSITEAKVQEDAENIDSLTLSAPFNHPYLSAIQPMASTIVCKKDALTVFEGRALDDGTDFYNTHTWTCESCLAYLKDTMQPIRGRSVGCWSSSYLCIMLRWKKKSGSPLAVSQ